MFNRKLNAEEEGGGGLKHHVVFPELGERTACKL